MWMVWTLLTLVVFCLVLSMVEELPAAFRRRPAEAALQRATRSSQVLTNCRRPTTSLR